MSFPADELIPSRQFLEAQRVLPDGDVRGWLTKLREQKLSDSEIAWRLRDEHKLKMTANGIRGWRLRLGVE